MSLEPLHVCSSCDRTWPTAELKDPKDLIRKLKPGDVFPSGECPSCGSPCHPEPSFMTNPTTLEDHIKYLSASLADIRRGLKEVADELRKQNKIEESRLQFNQKKQRLEALNFLKEEGLLEVLPLAKAAFKEYKNKDLEGEKEEANKAKEIKDGGVETRRS